MTVKSLNEALHEAYIQARDMEASLAERLQALPTQCDALARIFRRRWTGWSPD